MKKISEFKQNERYTMPLLVSECRNGTTNKGKPYLSLVLQDSSGSMDAKFWDVNDKDREIVQAGRICEFSFEVIEYAKNLQIRISGVKEFDQSKADLNDFMISSSRPEAERRKETEDLVNSIQNETYRKLVKGMLEFVGNRFYTYPAASRIHHNYMGGLSEHSLSMAELADLIAAHYPQLDRDLLISGTLVHDLGKTAEMSGPVTTEYTPEGKLEGHISIANGWLTQVSTEAGLQDTEECMCLHHMILAHHGHYEFGSPVLPMLQEAEVLCLIDNLDARMNTLKQALSSTRPGSFTQRIFALDNRQFYKPKGGKKDS
jgi:3'-5' exoribonuclease